MDLVLVAGGVFALVVIVLADRADDVVDRFASSDDPLTDFEDGDDSTESFDDA